MFSELWSVVKDAGAVAGLVSLAALARGWMVGLQIRPTHLQFRPLIPLHDAMRIAYERRPDWGDKWRSVHGKNNVLTGYGMLILQEARKGHIPVYGKRVPSTVPWPLPAEKLDWHVFARANFDWKTLSDGEDEWLDLSVSWFQLRRVLRKLRADVLFD
jgi:hypothetical protein